MPVVPPATGKTPSSTIGRRMLSINKGGPRTKRSLRRSSFAQQTNQLESSDNISDDMNNNNNNYLAPPRPPDPTLFISAGTTGLRHLLPVHLTENDCHGTVFSRPISRLRSRTPTTDLCTNIDMIRNACLSIKTLQHFDVSSNGLIDLPLDISTLIDLETFDCSHNQLTDIHDSFEQLKHLKELDLSYNNFQQMPNVIYTYKSLICLNFEHNLITKIDEKILNLKRLKFFIFDHNQLESMDTIDFGQMKKLEFIHIAHNQLIQFPRGLSHLNYLKNLNLSYNRLTSVPVDLFLINTLDVLNLSHNLLIKLPSIPITHKRSSLIFSIDLSYNQLTKFYDYLLFIALKIDVSNNKIRMLSNDLMKKLTNDMITNRELKINHNPLIQPVIPFEIFNGENSKPINALKLIKNYFDEQQNDAHVRQGFKICILGHKKSGKTSLANCLEEYMPLTNDEMTQGVQDRIVYVYQFPFRMTIDSDQLVSLASTVPPTSLPVKTPTNPKTNELPKIQLQRFEMDTRKRRNPPIQATKEPVAPPPPIVLPLPPPPPPTLPSTTATTAPPASFKYLPLTIYDFNGTSTYYEHMNPFIDTTALYLLCIRTNDFHQTTPQNIEDIFNGKYDISSSTILKQLFQLLQLLCDKVPRTQSIMIIPIATHIDLYDQRSAEEKIEAIEKINQFFKYYLEYRTNRIKHEIDLIHVLPTISSSFSDRLKFYTSLLSINIQIESCQPISSLTFQGIDELNLTIQRSVLIQKTIFPNVDRILPTLWSVTNQYIESLADILPQPYLLWENFTNHVTSKYGLSHLINDITMSLHDEGKILVLSEISTRDRVVFLRPSWLTDLLYNLYRRDMLTTYLNYDKNELFSLNNLSETNFQIYKKEFLQFGLLHSDLLRALWANLIDKKENFYHLWFTLMRFLLIAYPKTNKEELKRVINTRTPDSLSSKDEKQSNNLIDIKHYRPDESRYDIKFDYAIVPYYLPLVNLKDKDEELKRFNKRLPNIITIRYTSQSLPLAFFDRFSVSMILKLNVIYKKHWKNFLLGEHEQKDVRFIMETDHRTYVICHCGTNASEQAFEEIWNVLMPILNHLEEILTNLAPSNRFDRSVQCPYCKEFSFMGEWTTPKDLQCLKTKPCPSCNENVDTARLVLPNESKRRSEELLKRIRERHAKNPPKESSDISSTTTQLLVPPV